MIATFLSIKIKTDQSDNILRKKFNEVQKELGVTSKLRMLIYKKPITKWTDEIKKVAIEWMRDNNCEVVAIKVDDGFLIGNLI